MLRSAATRIVTFWRSTVAAVPRYPGITAARSSHDWPEDEDEFNDLYSERFLRWDIDGWEVRKHMNDICGMDLVPDPVVIDAGLRACRTINDIALAIRWLEACKNKCGGQTHIYSYILQQIKPTLKDLGIPTPEELRYDRPELALESVYDM